MEAARLPSAATALKLGELLVRSGVCTAEHVERALAEQRESGRRIGEILVAHGWAGERDVAEALADQYGVPFVDLARVHIDPAAARLLQETYAHERQVLPVRFLDNDVVQVAVADPTNLRTSDDLRLALGMGASLAVADATALQATIVRTYRLSSNVTDDVPDTNPQELALEAEQAGTIDLVNAMLGRALAHNASDIHLDPQPGELIVRERIDGVLRRTEMISRTQQSAVCARLKVMAGLDIAEKRMPQDGSFSVRSDGSPVDVRVAVIPTKYGEHVVLRLLQRGKRLELPDLGMSHDMESIFLRAIKQPFGAVITCGPTGSGKTTTLYAALAVLNEETRSIATIEDPVEYQLPGVNQIEVHPKIELTFARGLRTILRSDPEVILVGEIRDEETAKTAVQAAMTGHLVLTTLHTNDAASSIARLKALGVEPQLLPSAINCIVAQRLARRLCVYCRQPYTASPEEVQEVDVVSTVDAPTLYRATGCLQCDETGYRGRVALYEVMPMHGLGRLIVEGSSEEIAAAAVELGMRTLREDGIRHALAGVTSLDEVRRVAGDGPRILA
jgi:type IV pilus assembly protein PilB